MPHPTPEELAAKLARLERQLSHMRLQALLRTEHTRSSHQAPLDYAVRVVMCPPDFYCHSTASAALDDAEALFSRWS